MNVNVQIPFNLHNQPVGLGGNASSSRSDRRSPSGGANTSSSQQNSRAASPSPSLLMTGSITSLPSFEVEPRQPILNVRLVRGVGRGRASSSRVRGRLGRHGEEGGREMHVGNGESPEAEPTHVDGAAAEDAEDLRTPRPIDNPPQWAALQDVLGVSFHVSLFFKLISCQFAISFVLLQEATDDLSQTPQFTIQNAGVISRSWGD